MNPSSLSLFLIGCVAVSFGIGRSSSAAIFVVNNGDIVGLRSAITSANANNEDDVVELASGGNYLLTVPENGANGLPVIASDGGKSLTIHGNDATVQRSTAGGTPSFHIFTVGTGATVTISRLTIQNGFDPENAGGIDNEGTLTLDNCVVAGNTGGYGGGLGNYGGVMKVTHCLLDSNSAPDGGGVLNSGWLEVSGSTFTNNSAVTDIGGGAIFNQSENGDASVDIVNSTFVGNSAYDGGAICNFSETFAVDRVTITNSTLSGNSAFEGGGIYNFGFGDGDSFAFLFLTNVTLSGNVANLGGGISNDDSDGGARVEIGNSILSAGTTGGTIFGGNVTSRGHNLSSDSGGGALTMASDQINTDPKLDPVGLQDYGGPTRTIALLLGSPAIDCGDDATAFALDQRGFLRAGVSDLGAFEFGGTPIRIISITRSSNQHILLQARGIPNTVHTIQASPDLDPDHFVTIGTPQADPSGIVLYDDADAVGLTQCFYRLIISENLETDARIHHLHVGHGNRLSGRCSPNTIPIGRSTYPRDEEKSSGCRTHL